MVFDSPANLDPVSRILMLEAEVARKAKALGVSFRTSPSRVAPQIRSLSHSAQYRIEGSLGHLSHAFDLCMTQDIDPWNDTEFFQLSMRALGLSYSSDFLSRLNRGDVVEAYNMDRVQIFRNMRFMEISTYSLLEVLSYEWTQLFERPSHITQLIIKQTERDLWTNNVVIQSQVPRHFIRETLSGAPQVLEAQHRLFAPLFSGPGRPGGMLSVGVVRNIASNVDIAKDKISFI